jgi:hypothetical protein
LGERHAVAGQPDELSSKIEAIVGESPEHTLEGEDAGGLVSMEPTYTDEGRTGFLTPDPTQDSFEFKPHYSSSSRSCRS